MRESQPIVTTYPAEPAVTIWGDWGQLMQQLGFRRHNNMGLIGNNEPVNARIKLNELLILHFVIVRASTVWRGNLSSC